LLGRCFAWRTSDAAEQLRRDALSAPPIDPAWPLSAANQPTHA
jgi:hypothetical protein